MALGTPVAAAVAYSAQNGTSVSPAYPTGILASDVVLLITGQKPSTANGGTVTTPTGWTLREEILAQGGYGTTLGAGTGNTNLRIYSWNTPVAGQTGNLAVTLGTNNISWAFMIRIPKGAGAAQFGSADGSRATAPTAGTPFTVNLTNGASATNFQSGDLAIWAMCIPDPVTTPNQFSAHSVTATGATFATAVEFNEPDTTTGNDLAGFSVYASVSSGSSTAAPSITVTAAGTVTNVRGPIAMVRVREAPAPQTLTPSLFTNTQTFHNPTVTTSTALTASLFTNDQTFYGPTVTAGGATQNLTPGLFTNTQTFYGPTATATYSLTPGKYDNAQTFYAASVTQTGGPQTLLPNLYTNAQTFFAPTAAATYALTPALFTNAQSFFSPTVTATRTLTPGLFTNAQTFFAPTASATYALTPALFTNTATFYAATVTSGTTLAPNRYDNTQTFYSATVSRGAVTLQPARYDNAQTFYAPTVTPGAVSLQPGLLTNDQEFYSPVVGQSGGLQTLLPDLVENTQTFYSATVTPGTVTLAPQGYVDDGYVDDGYVGPNTFSTQIFYGPRISRDIQPPLVTNTSTFFAAAVESSLYTITRAQALRLLQIHLLHGLGASPLVVGASSRSAGAVEQTVAQVGTTVTISTTAEPSVFAGDAGTMIDELAALHGLTASLVVTPTSRTAGAISQTMAMAGTTTTVTRI